MRGRKMENTFTGCLRLARRVKSFQISYPFQGFAHGALV